MSHDWMPVTQDDKLIMARVWVEVLTARAQDWNVSPAEVVELSALTAAAAEAHKEAYEGHGNRALIQQAREALAAVVAFMRRLRRTRLLIPPLTDSDYLNMKMKPPDRIRTNHYEVREEVELLLRLRAPREIVVEFRVQGSTRRAKPADYVGATLAHALLGAPPSGVRELTSRVTASRSPHTLLFAEDERGRTLYVAAAWLNARAILGPWSGIQSAIVP